MSNHKSIRRGYQNQENSYENEDNDFETGGDNHQLEIEIDENENENENKYPSSQGQLEVVEENNQQKRNQLKNQIIANLQEEQEQVNQKSSFFSQKCVLLTAIVSLILLYFYIYSYSRDKAKQSGYQIFKNKNSLELDDLSEIDKELQDQKNMENTEKKQEIQCSIHQFKYRNECHSKCPNDTYIFQYECLDNCHNDHFIKNENECVTKCDKKIQNSMYCVDSCPFFEMEDTFHCVDDCPYNFFSQDKLCVKQCLQGYQADEMNFCKKIPPQVIEEQEVINNKSGDSDQQEQEDNTKKKHKKNNKQNPENKNSDQEDQDFTEFLKEKEDNQKQINEDLEIATKILEEETKFMREKQKELQKSKQEEESARQDKKRKKQQEEERIKEEQKLQKQLEEERQKQKSVEECEQQKKCYNEQTKLCEKCDSCKQMQSIEFNICVDCNKNYFLLNGECVQKCEEKSKSLVASVSDQICQHKDNNNQYIIRRETFFSKTLNINMYYLIVLPQQTSSAAMKRLNVLYYLHDLGNSYDSLASMHIPKNLNSVIVSVQGDNSLYIDSLHQNSLYQTYIVQDLIPHIEEKYSGIINHNKKYRGIVGEGMGGLGALQIALNTQLQIQFDFIGIYNSFLTVQQEIRFLFQENKLKGEQSTILTDLAAHDVNKQFDAKQSLRVNKNDRLKIVLAYQSKELISAYTDLCYTFKIFGYQIINKFQSCSFYEIDQNSNGFSELMNLAGQYFNFIEKQDQFK